MSSIIREDDDDVESTKKKRKERKENDRKSFLHLPQDKEKKHERSTMNLEEKKP